MGLVSFKMFLSVLLVALGLYLVWGLASGYVVWQRPTYACFEGKHFIPHGGKVTWMWVGNLQLRYQPYEFSCDEDHRFDPATYHSQDGMIVPNNK